MESAHRPTHNQSLPPITSITALTDGHPAPEKSPLPFRSSAQSDPRDSGNWSASKHSSGVSNNGFQLTSILNAEDSPSRQGIPETPLSARPNNLQPLPSLSHGFERQGADQTSLLDSRRSSVDSRMNVGMGHLQISPSAPSPYDKSQNTSRTSLVSNLQQQRGIVTDTRQTIAGPLSPLGQRNGLRNSNGTPRRAPPINNPRSIAEMPNPMSEEPTKGFPWAFPDAPSGIGQRRSSSAESDHRPSRQNSFAASINSSLYTNDSALPAGQKRFSDDMPSTHHHSMAQRSVSTLGEVPEASGATGNYSRTPELRVNHKLAERKRRSEMKSLFDELNNILPSPAGGKSSKWEVLTRAIDYVNKNKSEMARLPHYQSKIRELEAERNALREEAAVMYENLNRLDPNRPHIYGPFSSSLGPHNQSQSSIVNRQMPPMQNSWQQSPAVMQGVEYQPNNGFDRHS